MFMICSNSIFVQTRMADEQRMHLKRLEDEARDNYAAEVRAMKTAAAASNI